MSAVGGRFWAGVDWSESLNDVAVVDRTGIVVAQAQIPETPGGVKELLRLLSGLRRSHRHSRKQVPIAIEASRGLLVRALHDAGQPVVPLHPFVVARYRGRISPAKTKSDKADATLLANIIRHDGNLHRGLTVSSEPAIAIAILAQAQRRALRTRQHHGHVVRSLLREFHPAALLAWEGYQHNLLRAEARAVLRLAPTPRQAAALSKRRLADTLAAAGRTRMIDYQAGRLRDLFQERTLRQPTQVEEAMGIQLLASVDLLDHACATLEGLTERAEDAFLAHPHADIYRSFPGCGALTGARLLGEIGDDSTRFENARGLRAYAGAAPLTWASGGSCAVSHRRVANKRLAATGHTWAFATLTRSSGCRAYYDRRRERGDRHAAALRRLFGKLLSSLHYCLRTGEHYSEQIAFPPQESDGAGR